MGSLLRYTMRWTRAGRGGADAERSRNPARGALWLLLLGIPGFGCAPSAQKERPPAETGIVHTVAPRIEPPGTLKRRILKPDPEALDSLRERLNGNVSGHYPAYDGDSFFFTFPVRESMQIAPEQVLAQYVAPVLDAIGFERGPSALATPRGAVKVAGGNFKRLVGAVATEYHRFEVLHQPKTKAMIDAFLKGPPGSAEIDRALVLGEGMTLSQFVQGIERPEIHYLFMQVVDGVPIEHTLLLASRFDGETISSIRGTLFNHYVVVNRVRIERGSALSAAAFRELTKIDKRIAITQKQPESDPVLVLLPYVTDDLGNMRLHHAYRVKLQAHFRGQSERFLVWLDAQEGTILKLEPLFGEIGARGRLFKRDPGTGMTQASFAVDSSAGGQYTLTQSGVIDNMIVTGPPPGLEEVFISDDALGSTPSFANFDQVPINDLDEAVCASGINKAGQQIHLFGTLHHYRSRALGLGIFTPFPTSPWHPVVAAKRCDGSPGLDGWLCRSDSDCCVGSDCGTCAAWCNAESSLAFGACNGYYDPACPDAPDAALSYAIDNTVVAHEVGHLLTKRFGEDRPDDWCAQAACPVPVSWIRLHDLADFWADHFESTNCVGGWVFKNNGGVDQSLYCAADAGAQGLPRLHQVTVPYVPGPADDHFPERRFFHGHDGLGYGDGQIAAAALWQVRLGMRSKCRPSGTPQFGVRFARALKKTGFFGTLPSPSDAGIYRYLYELERELVEQWAIAGSPEGPPAFRHNGAHTTNKVTAGFARAGIFLIPPQCLDGDPATIDPGFCPAGENGGDAVIDIADNDAGDDPSIDGTTQPEEDFLELGGPAPTLHVWTGPRYGFGAKACVGAPVHLDGQMCSTDSDCACPPDTPACIGGGLCRAGERQQFMNPAPCNAKFRVEVASDPSFPSPATIASAWITVSTDPTNPFVPDCYGTWTPTSAEWSILQAGGDLSRIYYRAQTLNSGDANPRLSTSPGAGLRDVPPPYAVLTSDGESDY